MEEELNEELYEPFLNNALEAIEILMAIVEEGSSDAEAIKKLLRATI